VKVLFINDSSTTPNWGGRAATTALRTMIVQSGGDIFKTITLGDLASSSLDRHVDPTDEQLSYRDIVRKIAPNWLLAIRRRLVPNLLRDSGERLIPRRWAEYDECVSGVLSEASPWPSLVENLAAMDVAVIFGNGDIYGNGIVPRTLFFLAFLIKRHFGKPVTMVDHTAVLDHPDLLRVAEGVYPLFDDVVFRDEASAKRCESLCTGKIGADAAFWFQPAPRETWANLAGRPTYFDIWPDTAPFTPSHPYLCIGGSAAFGQATSIETILNGYLQLIAQIRSSYPGQIVLTVSDPTDQMIFRELARRLHLALIGPTTPVQQAVDILGNADAYIGGRWHPSVFALRGGAPVIPLSSHTFKMRALIEMTGLPVNVFDVTDLARNTDAIVQQLLQYLNEGERLRAELRSWGEGMAEKSWINVAYLDRFSSHDVISSISG